MKEIKAYIRPSMAGVVISIRVAVLMSLSTIIVAINAKLLKVS